MHNPGAGNLPGKICSGWDFVKRSQVAPGILNEHGSLSPVLSNAGGRMGKL
jgi:hypothetical protein